MLEILTYHVTVQPSASLLRNLPIPDRLRRGADSLLAQFTRSHGLWQSPGLNRYPIIPPSIPLPAQIKNTVIRFPEIPAAPCSNTRETHSRIVK